MKEIANIDINFGLRFENHDYTEKELLKIKENIERKYNLTLSSSYMTTLVGNFETNHLDNLIYFYQNTLKKIAKEHHIDIEILFNKNSKILILESE